MRYAPTSNSYQPPTSNGVVRFLPPLGGWVAPRFVPLAASPSPSHTVTSASGASAGEFEPLYRLPLDVQSGELPVLPLSISGAVTFARIPSTDSFLSGSDWFIYKFDKQQAGLAGLAFDEGTFGVFGWVRRSRHHEPA
jgi:hypothetical protein